MSNLKKLTGLELGYNNISKIEGLEGLYNLGYLGLRENRLLDPLANREYDEVDLDDFIWK